MRKRKETGDPEIERLSQQNAGLGFGNYRDEWADAPRWNDEDEEAQLEYVRNRILRGWFLVFPYRSEEERAVEAASRGDLRKLKAFIKANSQLAQSTRDLIIEFLGGKRSLRTGRAKGDSLGGKRSAKGKAGRPRMSEMKRRPRSPAHLATEIYLVLRGILPMIYPNKSETDIRDRAMYLAAKLKGVGTEAIQNHLDKSKNDRLPYRVYGYQEEDSPKWWSPDLL